MLWLQSSWPLIQMISWLLNRCKDHFHISLIFIHNNKKCMFLCITVRVQRCMKTLQFAQLSDQIVSVYSMRPWWMVLVSCLEVDCTWLGMEAASLYCADAKQRWNMFLSFPPTHKLPREYSPLPTNQPLAHQKFEKEKNDKFCQKIGVHHNNNWFNSNFGLEAVKSFTGMYYPCLDPYLDENCAKISIHPLTISIHIWNESDNVF